MSENNNNHDPTRRRLVALRLSLDEYARLKEAAQIVCQGNVSEFVRVIALARASEVRSDEASM